MNLASDQRASNTPTVADFLPQLAHTQSALVENLESVPPRYVDRARTTLKGLTGQSMSVSARWLKSSLRAVGCWRQPMRLGAVAGLDLRFICGRACLDAAFVSFMPR